MMDFYLPVLVVVLMAGLIVLTKPLHIHVTAKGHNGTARQSSHQLPTPRIGGICLISGYIAGLFVLPPAAFEIAVVLGISAIPVFLGGLGEDTGFDISPKKRLLLSFVSAGIAIALSGVWITDTGLPALSFLTFTPVAAIAFTIILTGGISHAVNLIDGLNGLAMGVSMMIALGLAGLAFSVDDQAVGGIALLVTAIIAGLLVFNYPWGKIFLGDAGAYSIGHVLTWIGIILIARNPEVAPFAVLLMFFWPIMDMLFAIARRVLAGRPVDRPDRLHFHQLTMRAIELVLFGRKRRAITNPLATLVVVPLASVPIFAAQGLLYNNSLSAMVFGAFCLGYVVCYVCALMCARRFARVGHRRRA